MLQATITFRPEDEDATGNGWALSLGQVGATPVTTLHATLTAAQNAQKAAFAADPEVDGYFTQAAEADVLAGEAAAVAAAKAALLLAEGL